MVLNYSKAECARVQKGLALSRSSEIAMSGARRLRSTLVAEPVLFARTAVIETRICRNISPAAYHTKRAAEQGEYLHLRFSCIIDRFGHVEPWQRTQIHGQ